MWFARHVRALARHYQVFEQLQVEKWDGSANGQSFLHNESIQNHMRRWLSSLKTGEVTPRALRNAVNSMILPDL